MVKVCNGYETKLFRKSINGDNRVISCPFCDAHPDCNKVFYQFSHSRRSLNTTEWCSKLTLICIWQFYITNRICTANHLTKSKIKQLLNR